MAPGEDCPTPPKNQPPAKVARVPWRTRRARRPRRRVCLLKGCGHVFRPQQPLARYCSEACREQARRWRQWKARRRYRRSSNGQQRRRAQSHRYRERRKQRPARENRHPNRCEGHPCKFFFALLGRAPATARGAMWYSSSPSGPRASGFVPWPADAPWSGFGRGRGAGASGASARSGQPSLRKRPRPCGDESLPISSGHIALDNAVSVISACAQGEEGERGPPAWAPLRSLFFFKEGLRAKRWNWNFINSNFVMSD